MRMGCDGEWQIMIYEGRRRLVMMMSVGGEQRTSRDKQNDW
jgi:hypothetical protein